MRGDDIGVFASLNEIRFRAEYPQMLVSPLQVVERAGAALLKLEHVSRAPDWHDTGELNAWKMLWDKQTMHLHFRTRETIEPSFPGVRQVFGFHSCLVRQRQGFLMPDQIRCVHLIFPPALLSNI